MPAEIMQFLAPAPGETAVDLTAGRGGHALLLASAVGAAGRLIMMDVDPANAAFAGARVAACPARSEVVHGSFDTIERVMADRGACAGAVLADLGFASVQVDDGERGFSFRADGPLDMRLDPSSGETAADLLARATEKELADAIYTLGEDPFARVIARAIVRQRASGPILTTLALADTVRRAYGARAKASRQHPATRTFMALRIWVNDELGALTRLMSAVERGARAAQTQNPTWLQPGARIAVISFHSLEDREVKQAFHGMERQGLATRLTRKPATPSEAEITANPRARSAKLRAVQVAPAVSPDAARSHSFRG